MEIFELGLDETLDIGDEISVTVVNIRGDKVRLGTDCPPQMPVHRNEVWEAIQRENAYAARRTHETVAPQTISAQPQLQISTDAAKNVTKEPIIKETIDDWLL